MSDSLIRSNTSGRYYSVKKSIRVIDHKQATLYMSNGVYFIDAYASKDRKTNEPIMVYVYEKNDQTQRLYELWKKGELK